MINPFSIGLFYNFNTLAPGILPSTFTNVKVLAIVNFDIANLMQNVTAISAAVYPNLPVNSNPDPTSYQYVIVQTNTGSKTVLALDWLDLNSVINTNSVIITATVSNVTLADVVTIKQALIQMGYNSVKLNTSTSIPATLVSLTILPLTTNLPIGQHLVLVAIGLYSDNSVINLSTQVNWVSADTTKVSINNSTATGLTVGTTNITAEMNGITSNNSVITVV